MERIELKNVIRLFHIDKKTIFNIAGKSYCIDDENKLLYYIAKNATGTSAESILKKVREKIPEVSQEVVNDVINQLDDLYFLEDLNKDYSSNTLEYFKERYSRNIDYLGSFCKLKDNKYELQEKIFNTKVVVLGLGGLGSHILYDLIGMGFYKIKAIDFDKIDLSNLNRQIMYNEEAIGRRKIEVAKETIDNYMSKNEVEFVECYIDGADKVYELVKGYDLVVAFVDRPNKIVSWINEGCVKAGVPFINGGVDYTRGIIYSVIPKKTGCVKCWENKVGAISDFDKKLHQEDKERDWGLLPWRPAIVNIVATLAGIALSEAVRFAIGKEMLTNNKLLEFDSSNYQTEIVETWDLDTNCSICSKEE